MNLPPRFIAVGLDFTSIRKAYLDSLYCLVRLLRGLAQPL